MLARLLGFRLDNRGGGGDISLNQVYYYPRNACLLFVQGYYIEWLCVQFAQVWLVMTPTIIMS